MHTKSISMRRPGAVAAGLVALGVTAGTVFVTSGSALAADPPGNNGTVKIADHGDMDSIPNNSPHQGCVFDVQWYGFDAGPKIISKVTFAQQSPTTDGTMTVSGPSKVFVGDDAAGGGTDWDGQQAYTLSFTGNPHPKQGYHVKLTINTPGSIGADVKHKVFWVQGCKPEYPPQPY
jgi:hypothetical protein